MIVNGSIEKNLAVDGHSDHNKLAYYKPYAVTYFRSRLRHTYIYDA